MYCLSNNFFFLSMWIYIYKYFFFLCMLYTKKMPSVPFWNLNIWYLQQQIQCPLGSVWVHSAVKLTWLRNNFPSPQKNYCNMKKIDGKWLKQLHDYYHSNYIDFMLGSTQNKCRCKTLLSCTSCNYTVCNTVYLLLSIIYK